MEDTEITRLFCKGRLFWLTFHIQIDITLALFLEMLQSYMF